jgi:hypothetical protein
MDLGFLNTKISFYFAGNDIPTPNLKYDYKYVSNNEVVVDQSRSLLSINLPLTTDRWLQHGI